MCRDKNGSNLTDGPEIIVRWKQDYNEQLYTKDNTGTYGHDSGGNYYVCTADDGNQLLLTLRVVKSLTNLKQYGVVAFLLRRGV